MDGEREGVREERRNEDHDGKKKLREVFIQSSLDSTVVCLNIEPHTRLHTGLRTQYTCIHVHIGSYGCPAIYMYGIWSHHLTFGNSTYTGGSCGSIAHVLKSPEYIWTPSLLSSLTIRGRWSWRWTGWRWNVRK